MTVSAWCGVREAWRCVHILVHLLTMRWACCCVERLLCVRSSCCRSVVTCASGLLSRLTASAVSGLRICVVSESHAHGAHVCNYMLYGTDSSRFDTVSSCDGLCGGHLAERGSSAFGSCFVMTVRVCCRLLRLDNNTLSGSIPSILGNLTLLS